MRIAARLRPFVVACAALCLLAGPGATHAQSPVQSPDLTARILAGIEAAPPSGSAPTDAVLQRYTRAVTSHWRTYERGIGGPLRAWARSELPAAAEGTIFYPFSGPDLPTVHGFFPLAGRYVLVALQPAEAPLVLQEAAPPEVAALLEHLQQAWAQFAHLGFFRTPDLDAAAKREGLRPGITGVLMAFAARLGMRVNAVEPVRVNADGSDLEPHPGDRADPATWRSVRLRLVTAEGRPVVVDYIRADLSNAGLGRSPHVRAWVEQMSTHRTMLKAASHLLQRPHFTTMRDAILAGSPLIVQEETGLDYADLARAFDVTLYGRFTGPHPLFAPETQRSLVQAYEAARELGPLPFRVSYQRRSGANLQVAVRIRASTPPEEAARQALRQQVEEQLARHAARPRRLFLTRTAPDPVHAEYVDRVRTRAVAALAAAGVPAAGSALVSLAIAQDGTLRAVHVERSSGNATLDRHVRSLPELLARAPAWPTVMLQQADEIVVTLHLPE